MTKEIESRPKIEGHTAEMMFIDDEYPTPDLKSPLLTDEQREQLFMRIYGPVVSRETLRQAWGFVPMPPLTWRTMARRRRGGVELRIHLRQLAVYLEPRDWWIGYYRGTSHHYVCVLPCLVIRWNRR